MFKKILFVHLALLLVNFIYGANYTIAKSVMPDYIGAYGFILLRILSAGLVIFIFHQLSVREKIQSTKDLLYIALCSFFGVAANMTLFFKGLSITTPINASVLMITTPVFVVVFSAFLQKERLSLRIIVGILLGVAGSFVLIQGTKMQFNQSGFWGDIMVMGNAMSYGLYLVLVKPLVMRYNPITIMKWGFIFGSIYVLPIGYKELVVVPWAQLPLNAWLSVLYVIIFTTVIAYFLNAWSLKKISPSVVGSYIYLQPVFATLIALFYKADRLTFTQLISMGTIFLGVYMVSSKSSGSKIFRKKVVA